MRITDGVAFNLVKTCGNTKFAWDSLIDQYEASSYTSLIELRQEFALCHYNLYDDADQWFIALDQIRLQLKSHYIKK